MPPYVDNVFRHIFGHIDSCNVCFELLCYRNCYCHILGADEPQSKIDLIKYTRSNWVLFQVSRLIAIFGTIKVTYHSYRSYLKKYTFTGFNQILF